MPELPEVETLKNELKETILGKKIVEVCIHNPIVVRQPKPDDFRKGLLNATIKDILRRAKVLILELSNGKSLVIHLKMTGQLIYPGEGKKSRVSFRFSDGNYLDFFDQRLFAELRLLDDWRKLEFIKQLGPEPFELEIEEFKKMLAERRTKIKSLLMDQHFISGVGNLYAAEALFRARIHPEKAASSLSEREKELLFKELIQTLREAIKYKGSSVDDYVRLKGQPGGYVAHHKVYGREGKPCLVCGRPIKRITTAGRGTYFCPYCQK